LYLLRDNALVYSLGVVSKFLAKRGIPVLSHPPCSSNLVPTDSFLFPKLKTAMKGMKFEVVSSIQQAVMRELKVIWEEAFAQTFDSLYE
jgi:hypothetical protein